MRGGAAVLITLGATLVAAGCGGGGGGGGASDAASDSKALDLVPKTALGYVTVDTDFDGERWSDFNERAKAFDADFKPVEELISEEAGSGEEKADYEADVKPWLGKAGGAAILSVKEEQAVGWVEVTDRAKLEKFLEKSDYTEGKAAGDFTLWKSDDDDTAAVSKDLVLFGDDAEAVREMATHDGDSITDADGVEDLTGELEGDALGVVVLSGDAMRRAIKEGGKETEDLRSLSVIKGLKGMAASFGPDDEGLRLQAVVKGKDLGTKNGSRKLFTDLPENTLFALGGQDLGGNLERTAEDAGENNAQVQQGIGAASGALGVDLKDLAEAFDGEFALALSGEDEGLQGLLGTAAGAAMGKSTSNLDPESLAKSGALTLAFENSDTTAETVDKIFGAVSSLAGGTTPKTGTSGDFETKTTTVAGSFPVTAAVSDDVSAISAGVDVFDAWGDSKLTDNETYKDAMEAAGAPDEVNASVWLDWPRASQLAGLEGGDEAKAGGWVGWGEGDGETATFDLFMHVESD